MSTAHVYLEPVRFRQTIDVGRSQYKMLMRLNNDCVAQYKAVHGISTKNTMYMPWNMYTLVS